MSVIIPCFNEAEGMANLTSRLRALEPNLPGEHELVFVDDGSADSTYEKLKEIYRDRITKDVKIIRHSCNKSVGAALRTGISNSNGKYIAVIDSDCTYEPPYLVDMLRIMKKENADIITASPYHPKGATRGVPRWRLFLSRNLSRLYNIVSKSRFYTYTSMFRIYRADAIKKINFKSNGFLAMAEILVKAHKNGFKVVEYPATLKGREFGASSAKTLGLIKEHLIFLCETYRKT